MIDVIIPTYNRARALREVIDSYFVQIDLGQIIIVDDCSTDDTPILAALLAEQYPGRIVYHRLQQKSTLPQLRNIGIEIARNEYIFMGEDDVYLPTDHFKTLKENIVRYNADIIAGRRINVFTGQSVQDALKLADRDNGPIFVRVPFEAYFERPVQDASEVYTLHSNVLMKRSVYERVQYDPLFEGNAFREETDFFLRAHAAGFHLWLIPDTVSYHMKGLTINKTGGARKRKIIYEWYVWKNTARLFLKNRNIFRKEFGVVNIYWYLLRCLIARYSYGIQRRYNRRTFVTHERTST